MRTPKDLNCGYCAHDNFEIVSIETDLGIAYIKVCLDCNEEHEA